MLDPVFSDIFIGVRLISVCIIVLLNIRIIKNDKTYILNQLLFISICLVIIANLSDLFAFLISPINLNIDKIFYLLFNLTITTAIALIFLVSYGLSSGLENLKNIYKIFVFLLPLFVSWFIAIIIPINVQTINIGGISYQVPQQYGIIAFSAISVAVFYFMLSLFYLTKTYHNTDGITRIRLKYFISGFIILIVIGTVSVTLTIVLKSSTVLDFFSQMSRPLGIIIGGTVIGLGLIKT